MQSYVLTNIRTTFHLILDLPLKQAGKNILHNICFFYVLLTEHLSIILAIDQINAINYCCTIRLLYSSTCFEHCCAHHQQVKLCYTASGIVTLCRFPSGVQIERGLCTGRPPTGCDHNRCCIIQFDLLMMSITMFETFRGI